LFVGAEKGPTDECGDCLVVVIGVTKEKAEIVALVKMTMKERDGLGEFGE
jgi:hypothetical protein